MSKTFLVLLFLFYTSSVSNSTHYEEYKESNYDDFEMDYYDAYSETANNDNTFRTMQENGNVTVTSKSCGRERCAGSWGAWQTWTECSIPLPGNKVAQCHNTMHMRRRFCAQSDICHEVNWAYCVHQSSCSGEWSQWTNYGNNCSNSCDRERQRKRTCYSTSGLEMPAICYGSGTESVQIESIECPANSCSYISFEMKLGFGVGGMVLLIIIIIIVIIMISKRRNINRETSLVSSQSFLLGHWRILSRRFTRRTRSEPQPRLNPEIAIKRNYSAVHVYESPNDYSQVLDNAEGNIYEETLGMYGTPCVNEEGRPRTNTVVSEERYQVIGITGPYARMQPVDLPGYSRQMRRARSFDDVLSERNLYRSRPLPGSSTKNPKKLRGATQLPRVPSYNGVAARIARRQNESMKRITKLPQQYFMDASKQMASASVHIEQNKEGYMIPNVREKEISISSTYKDNSSNSLGLPISSDIDVYVTMKNSKKQAPQKH
ncbi:uncharacterized protein LOC120347742 [Styela clava]